MPKNKIENLRNLMFETIERLMDDDDQGMDVRKAREIAHVGRVIVETAKVEVEFMKASRTAVKSNFINMSEEPKELPGDELPDCKCGDLIYPADAEQSQFLGLDYPRCAGCLSLLPKQIDKAKANTSGMVN